MTDERGHAPTPHESDNPLDREIRRLLAVDPSPAFEARVRARVAAEPTPNAWRAGRLWMGFGAAAAALVLAVAVFRPEAPADTGSEPELGIARSDNPAPSPAGTARLRRDGATADRSTTAVTAPPAAPGPTLPGSPEIEPRVATGAPRATSSPPGPPRFTRVVFSASERGALRQLLAQARSRPVVVPVPTEALEADAAGEAPAELGTRPGALEPPVELEVSPISIEPLNLALLEMGAVE